MTRLYIIIALTVVIAVVSQVKADCVHNIYGKVFCGACIMGAVLGGFLAFGLLGGF